ncbi:4-alpha-glucanotransferase [Kaarinaea lacus]
MSIKTKNISVLDQRRAGVLLHPTSLPGDGVNGDLGPEAYHFVDYLNACGISVWQVLPLGPTHEDGSPYMGLSVLAGNPQLISVQLLVDWGWLNNADVVSGDKLASLQKSWLHFDKNAKPEEKQELSDFTQCHQSWLEDFALFQALRQDQQGRSWVDWPAALRDKDAAAIKKASQRLTKRIQQQYFEQFVFFKQWHNIKQYANERGILLFGDMPIFVAHDSAEVWAHREYFDLNDDGHARTIAGVPPDYFSATGQRWGNPQYDWKRMREDDFLWWRHRIGGSLELYDFLRVDHFRGFEAFWEIDAEAQTAIDGKWVKAPGAALFKSLLKAFKRLPLVAEDLGTITPEVDALREQFAFPGMKILQFAFDGNHHNPYLPHNHTENSVVYTGTHDNNTTLSWFESLQDHERQTIYDYLGLSQEPMPWALIRSAMASTARLAMLPMQDLLSLGQGERMNTPGVKEGNWIWRFKWSQTSQEISDRIKHMVQIYGRADLDG